MDWFKPSKPSMKLPPANPLQIQRSRQIESLKTVPNIVEIHRDQDYQVTVHLTNLTLYIKIHLPPMFPQKPPILSVTPSVSHPWIDASNAITGCPSLNQFTMHSDFARVVRGVIDEFHRNAPQPRDPLPYALHPVDAARGPVAGSFPHHQQQTYGLAAPSYMAQFPPPSLSTSAGVGPIRPVPGIARPSLQQPPQQPPHHQPQPPQQPHHQPQPPQQPHHQPQQPHGLPPPILSPPAHSLMPTLSNKTNEELQLLHDSEADLLNLLLESDEVKALSVEREKMCDRNEEMAKNNLAKKPIIEEKKKELLEKLDTINDLRRDFSSHSEKQREFFEKLGPAAVHARLKEASLEAEEASNQVATTFLKGKMEVGEFLETFIHQRTVHHLRRVKEERFDTAAPY